MASRPRLLTGPLVDRQPLLWRRSLMLEPLSPRLPDRGEAGAVVTELTHLITDLDDRAS
jgi:hypothetical protein